MQRRSRISLVSAGVLLLVGVVAACRREPPPNALDASVSGTVPTSSAPRALAVASAAPALRSPPPRAAPPPLPQVSAGELPRVIQMSGGLLFAPRPWTAGDAILVRGRSGIRQFHVTAEDDLSASLTEDAHDLLRVRARHEPGGYALVGSTGEIVWQGTTRPSPYVHREGTFFIGGNGKEMEHVTFAKTALGYRVVSRRAYAVTGDRQHHLVDGIELAMNVNEHDLGGSLRAQTFFAAAPNRPNGPLAPLSPALRQVHGRYVCRSGKTAVLLLLADEEGYFFFHDGQAWSRGQPVDLRVVLEGRIGSFGCDDTSAWFAGQRGDDAHHVRCTPSRCTTTRLPLLNEPATGGSRDETSRSTRAAIGDKLLEVRVVDDPDSPQGASIRFRFGSPLALPARERVFVADSIQGTKRFASVRLYGMANGAVLRITDASDTPGTSLVFFDADGEPTVLGGP